MKLTQVRRSELSRIIHTIDMEFYCIIQRAFCKIR